MKGLTPTKDHTHAISAERPSEDKTISETIGKCLSFLFIDID